SWPVAASIMKDAILSSSCRQTYRAYGMVCPPLGSYRVLDGTTSDRVTANAHLSTMILPCKGSTCGAPYPHCTHLCVPHHPPPLRSVRSLSASCKEGVELLGHTCRYVRQERMRLILSSRIFQEGVAPCPL